MSWKKNIFSYLVWAVYLFVTGTAMTFIGSAISDSVGAAEYIGGMAAAAYLLITGLIVFVLHKLAVKLNADFQDRGKVFTLIEGILVVVLSAVGLSLRIAGLQGETGDSVFLDLAYVSTDGQSVPLFSHGAVYIYIWLLRLIFMLLGNKAAVALGLQIMLQMLGVVILYFAVRKMAGIVPALMMLAVFMISPYMLEQAAFLSPQMFYMFLFSVALLYVSRGVERVYGWFYWLFAGVMTAVLIYMDVAGILLIPLMLGVIVMRRQEVKRQIVGGMLGSAMGLLLGIAACVFADAFSSSKSVLGIIEAWLQLYRFSEPRFAITLYGFDMVWLVTILLCFMAWGIFSFWCSRKVERFSIWILCLLIVALMQCLGVFTEEMSGAVYIFFFSTVLAGLSVRESIVAPVEESAGEETAGFTELEVEELGEDEKEKEKIPKEEIHKADKIVAEKTQTTEEGRETVETEKRLEENRDRKEPEKKREIEYIENPLPLPKKHVKRVMDYAIDSEPDPEKGLGGYDVDVSDDDDFDH